MLDVLSHCAPELPLGKEDHPAQALSFDRSYESFRERIQIWTALGNDAQDFDPPGRQLDGEQHMEADKSMSSPNLDGEQIGSGDNVPVRSEECFPRHSPPRRWLDPVVTQNSGDGRTPYFVTKVGQGSLNPGISPRRILVRHPDCQFYNLLTNRRSPQPPAATSVILPRDQLTMPAQESVRRDDRAKISQYLASKTFRFHR